MKCNLVRNDFDKLWGSWEWQKLPNSGIPVLSLNRRSSTYICIDMLIGSCLVSTQWSYGWSVKWCWCHILTNRWIIVSFLVWYRPLSHCLSQQICWIMKHTGNNRVRMWSGWPNGRADTNWIQTRGTFLLIPA